MGSLPASLSCAWQTQRLLRKPHKESGRGHIRGISLLRGGTDVSSPTTFKSLHWFWLAARCHTSPGPSFPAACLQQVTMSHAWNSASSHPVGFQVPPFVLKSRPTLPSPHWGPEGGLVFSSGKLLGTHGKQACLLTSSYCKT